MQPLQSNLFSLYGECSICFEEMNLFDAKAPYLCKTFKHYYHIDCLDEGKGYCETCPVCRAEKPPKTEEERAEEILAAIHRRWPHLARRETARPPNAPLERTRVALPRRAQIDEAPRPPNAPLMRARPYPPRRAEIAASIRAQHPDVFRQEGEHQPARWQGIRRLFSRSSAA